MNPEIAEYKEICRQGEEADQRVFERRNQEAIDGYIQVVHLIGRSGAMEQYHVSKVCLGLAIAHIQLKDPEAAFNFYRRNFLSLRLMPHGGWE